jgi:hypothetical protein
MGLMRRVVQAILLAAMVLPGCEFNPRSRPSILVVAVEGLGFDSLGCDSEQNDDGGYEGLRALCGEAVRFSHAFSPSTMSQASMASLLTGLYPVDHGVRNNGGDFLSARFQTLGEAALGRGYHTLFVSGGPPLWRKSGLAQGFEIFDDVVDVTPGLYYRPAGDVFRTVTRWIDQDTGTQPFLAVLFLADLQFPDIATRTDEGEIREKSPQAQLAEVIESFGYMVRWLKARKRWNSTNIVVAGLDSFTRGENDHEPSPLSLRSNSVQVGLFIKPARKERDNMIQWAVDRNVSLVDVGVTMFEWLGLKAPPSSLAEVQPRSLAPVLSKPQPNWSEDRLILSETAWPDWLEGDGVRWAVRQNRFLYIHDRKPLIYNTLTDRMENMPLKTNDPLWLSLNGGVMNLLHKAQTPPFRGLQPRWIEQLGVARELWRDGVADRKPAGDEAWTKWYLRAALASRDWREVRRYSQHLADPIGIYVAARQMGEALPMPRNPCLRLILAKRGDKKSYQSECEDEKVLALYAWQSAHGEEQKQAALDRFARMYAQYWMDQDIGRLSYLNDLRWDVDRELPEAPQLADYLLTFKDFDPVNKKTLALLNAEHGSF